MAKQEYTIYYTKNTENNKLYVGCFKTENNYLSQRKSVHKYLLRNNEHPNSDLQDDFNKYGEEVFQFCIKLDIVYDTKANAMKEEQRWMDLLGTKGDRGYNRVYNGYTRSDEVKKSISEKNSGANHGMAKSVMNIKTGEVFDTGIQAAEYFDVHVNTISNHCNNKVNNPEFKFVD